MTALEFDLVVIGGGIVGSFLAARLARAGVTVAVIEKGPATLAAQVEAAPRIRFLRRQHKGCEQARNHVLGGNGHYWGGALMRPPGTRLTDVIGLDDGRPDQGADLAPHFSAVERRYGLPFSPSRFTVDEVDAPGFVAADAPILPGRSRNISAVELNSLRRATNARLLPSAEVVGFELDRCDTGARRLRAVAVRVPDGLVTVGARTFVIAAGTVDSILLTQRIATELGVFAESDDIGTRLHDHWSVPLARVRLGNSSALRDLLAPRFRGGAVLGRHFETQSKAGWHARGFLHFTFWFDEVSPYREIKRLMQLRQQRAGLGRIASGALPLVKSARTLATIAFERWWLGRLHLGDDVPVVATLDFEVFPHPQNAIRQTPDGVSFYWDISREDEISFSDLAIQCRGFLRALEEDYGLRSEPLHGSNAGDLVEHLHRAATDAFHLGGGLSVGRVSDSDLRLRGTDNVFAISSGAFARPGVVNPTLSLLALAERFANDFLGGRLPGG